MCSIRRSASSPRGSRSRTRPTTCDAAVRAARAAFPAWAATPALKRARVLFKFKEIVEQRRGELAKLIASEHGKLVSDAAGEVTRGLEVVEFACGAPHLLKGEFADNVGTGVDSYSLRQPLGVAAGHHAVQFSGDGAAVDVSGGAGLRQHVHPQAFGARSRRRTVVSRSGSLRRVCRPACSTWSMATRSRWMRCCVIPEVNAVSFVGSTPIAEYVQREGVAHGKRVQALGGAKNHLVMLPDADTDAGRATPC